MEFLQESSRASAMAQNAAPLPSSIGISEQRERRRASLADLAATPRDAAACTVSTAALGFLLPSAPTHDPAQSKRTARLSVPTEDVLRSPASPSSLQLGRSLSPMHSLSSSPSSGILLRRNSDVPNTNDCGVSPIELQDGSDEELLEELRDSDGDDYMDGDQFSLGRRSSGTHARTTTDDTVLTDALDTSELSSLAIRQTLRYVRDELCEGPRRVQSPDEEGTTKLKEAIEQYLGGSTSQMEPLVDLMTIKPTQDETASPSMRVLEQCAKALPVMQRSLDSVTKKDGICSRIRQASETGKTHARHSSARDAIRDDMTTYKTTHRPRSVLSSPSSAHEELRNPFAEDDTFNRSHSFPTEDWPKKSEAALRLVNVLQSLQERLSSHQTQASTSSCEATQDPAAAIADLRKQIVPKQPPSSWRETSPLRSPSPRPFSPKVTRSTRSSLTSSPVVGAADVILGDPAGEALAAGMGSASQHQLTSATGNKTSVTFLPTPPPLVALSSSRGDDANSRLGQSPPPRYSSESMRSWASAAFAATHGADKAEGKKLEERRGSASSEMSWSGTSSVQPPAYFSNLGLRLGNLRKGSSTSSLLPAEHKTARSRLLSTPPVHDNAVRDEKSRLDLRNVEHSIDRLYDATPRLDDQCAGPAVPKSRRMSKSEDDFQHLMEKMTQSDRLNDQRALRAPPSSSSKPRIEVDTRASASKDKALLRPVEGDSKSPGSSRQKPRRFPSVSSLSLGGLKMRKAVSILERANNGYLGKGKSRQASPDAADPSSAGGSSTAKSSAPIIKGSTMPASRESAGKHEAESARKRDCIRDDDFFRALSKTSSKTRMADQDAVLRKSTEIRPTNGQTPPAIDTVIEEASGAKHDIAQEGVEGVDGLSSGESLPRKRSKQSSPTTGADKLCDDRGCQVGVAARKDGTATSAHACKYIAEYQPQIRAISVSLWKASDTQSRLVAHCAVSSASPTLLEIHMPARDGEEETLFLQLPASAQETVVDAQGTAQQGIVHWSLRLSADGHARSVDVAAYYGAPPLTAKELQAYDAVSLQCRYCSTALAQFPEAPRYVQLPSHHWEELVDAWMCHADQELSGTIVQAQKDLANHAGLGTGQVHVSDTDVIVKDSLLCGDNIGMIDERLCCKSCHAQLGKRAVNGATKLRKHALSIQNRQGLVSTKPIGAFVAHDLIRMAQTHASRRFLVQGKPEGSAGAGERPIRLSLWLFAASMEVAIAPFEHLARISAPEIGTSTAQVASSTFVGKVCKVLYQDLSNSEETSQPWTLPESPEPIDYPHRVCAELLATLRAANDCYPPSSRVMLGGAWRTAFLPLY